MEYGEKLEARGLWYRHKGSRAIYRFRIDPVPFIHRFNGWFGNWYKRPKSTQERKMSYAYKKYVRGKRSASNLPNSWDDIKRSDCRTRKSWKNRFKCRKQWEIRSI